MLPRGPKPSPTGTPSGRAKRRIERGGGRRSAASVAGPATPSAPSPAQAWKRRSAAPVRGPRPPSTGPDGNPWRASRNCRPATSQPRAPALSAPRAEARAAAAAERPAGARAGDAVHDEPAAGLQRAHRGAGARAGDAVDAAAVEPLGAQRHLQRGRVRRDPGEGRGGAEQREDDGGEGDPCHPADPNRSAAPAWPVGAMLHRIGVDGAGTRHPAETAGPAPPSRPRAVSAAERAVEERDRGPLVLRAELAQPAGVRGRRQLQSSVVGPPCSA